MESTDEVTRKTLELLQSSDFAKELEQFNAKCIRPTMNVMAKKIIKAKKKLKKLQKRQRKQDMQGVSNTADQWPSDEWRKKQPISNGDKVEVKLGGCDEWFKGTVIRARKQEVELDPHDYTYPKIADETNIVDIRII